MCLWLQSFKFNWLNEKRQPPFGRLRHVLGERTERRHGSSTQAIIRANLKRDPSAFRRLQCTSINALGRFSAFL
jgi:hypothetical protein